MKRIFIYTGISLVALAAIVLAAFWYAGIFAGFTVIEKEVGPYSGLFDDVYGDHADASEVRNAIYRELKGDKIRVSKVFGVYYKEALKTPQGQLMGYAGCIVDHKDSIHLNDLRYKYKKLKMARKRRIVVDIRYENNLTQLAGMLRIYPAMREYARVNGYPVQPIMEIYDLPNQRIRYVMPIKEANKARVFE